jgi:hypothetical protein
VGAVCSHWCLAARVIKSRDIPKGHRNCCADFSQYEVHEGYINPYPEFFFLPMEVWVYLPQIDIDFESQVYNVLVHSSR